MGKPYEIRKIQGEEKKLCKGPTHPEGGEWIPITEFYKRRYTSNERLRAWCKSCEHLMNYGKLPPELIGYLPISKYRFAIRELETKLGRQEARRRVGVGKTTWYAWVTGKRNRIQKAKAALLLRTLTEVRSTGEVRHRKSIRHGSYLRGREEKSPSGKGSNYGERYPENERFERPG